jgi:SPP1 gp7 family putative phage head morphogenesis protein
MPTLRERLGSWIGGKRAATEALGFHAPYAEYYGRGIGTQTDHKTLLQENIGTADSATRAIANRLASLALVVKVSRRTVEGTVEDEILDDHPLADLLRVPHPTFTMSQLLRLMGQYIPTVGEAYFLKVGNRLGVPTELHPIPPWLIDPQPKRGVVVSYLVTDGGGKQFQLPADVIVRPFFPDPESPWTSEGYLGPTGITVDSAKFAGQHLRSHYQNDATPKTYLKATAEATGWDPDDKAVWEADWRKRYHQRLGSSRGLPGITPSGYDLTEMRQQTGVEMLPLLEFWRDETLMAFGTPRSILGQVVSGDRSSAETNQYVFDKHTILPIASLIAESFTNQLAKDFDPALFVEFEQFVSKDKRFDLEQEQSDLDRKVHSINSVLTTRGEDPVPWGDEPVGKIGEMPYDPDLSFEIGDDEPGALGDEEPEPSEPDEESDERMRSESRASSFFTPDAEWQRQISREKAYTPSFERAMLSILTEQKRDVLKKLNAAMPRARVTADEIFDPGDPRWSRLYGIRVEPIRQKAFLAIITEVLAGFDIDEFIFTDAMREVLRRQGAQLVANTGRTTQKKIARQLQLGVAEGEGIDQIAKRIRGVFRTRRKQARTIARTEVLKASQQAQLESMEITGTEKKQWFTSRDAAVRDSHAYADGQIRSKGEPFNLAGELADAPGIGAAGGDLSAANSINCRCFVLPVVEE